MSEVFAILARHGRGKRPKGRMKGEKKHLLFEVDAIQVARCLHESTGSTTHKQTTRRRTRTSRTPSPWGEKSTAA